MEENKILGGYSIISEIGHGGMGVVYKAYDSRLERFVAIKLLKPEIVNNEKLIEKFKNEARNQAKMNHPNIVSVFGLLEEDGNIGIVMEFVEGESLDKFIFRNRKLHLYDSLSIVKEILSGLKYAHNKGFVHRDIKPSNIILSVEGIAKIMDFGISKTIEELNRNQCGIKAGTSHYMSPEQIQGENVDFRTDIYSIGCTLYEMLTGDPPFIYSSEEQVFDAHLHEEPVPVNARVAAIPAIVNELVLKSLKKNPDERFQNMQDFYKAVDKVDLHLAKVKQTEIEQKNIRRKNKKLPSIIAFSGFIVLLLAISYFAFTQVDSFLKSDQMDKLRDHSIYSILKSDIDFSKQIVTTVSTGNSLNSIKTTKNDIIYGTGDRGVFFLSRDNGIKWQTEIVDSSVNLRDAFLFEDGRCIVIGDNSSIFIRNGFESKWERITLKDKFTLFKIEFINDKEGFIVGSKGLIVTTKNGGMIWDFCNSGTSEILFDFCKVSEKKYYVCGWDGIILFSEDSGLNWKKFQMDDVKYFKSIVFSDHLTGVAVGSGGTVFRTANGGEKWNKINIPVNQPLNKILSFNGNRIFAIGNKGVSFYSNDWGKNWDMINLKTYTNLNSFCITKENKIFISCFDGKIISI